MKNYHDYKVCIDACLNCAALCNHCASEDAKEKDIEMMRDCIQLCMECATMCYAAAQTMRLGGRHAKEICMLCANMCDDCFAECSKHSHEHCKECAAACKTCAEECRKMINTAA